MDQEMMTRNSFPKKRTFLLLFIFIASLAQIFASENKKWVLAAEKFKFSKGQNPNEILEATAETLPSRILEKIGQSLIRAVEPDERLERLRYDSRNERISLFLQLSNEYKKRDSIVLNDYSNYEMKKKLKEQEKKIQDVKNKINDNLQKLKESEDLTDELIQKEESIKLENKSNTEFSKYKNLVKNLFDKKESFYTYEDINFYGNDFTSLFLPTEDASRNGYQSYEYEKQCNSSKINSLLTGTITSYDDYLSVNIELYNYPGGKKIYSVIEVGSMQELDLLCTSIAHDLLPVVVNSMPVNITIEVAKENLQSEVFFYLDNQLLTSHTSDIVINSGVHTIQFTAEGYKTIATSYFFEGNKKYLIEVNMEEQKNGKIEIGLKNSKIDLLYQKLPFHKEYPQEGKIYANGVETELSEDNVSQITINGNVILGQFISEDGLTDFYYIPKKIIIDGSKVTINPKAADRSKYIDTRRKWMYGSYSALITSLIPTFYCYGRFLSCVQQLNEDKVLASRDSRVMNQEEFDKDLANGRKWEKAKNVTAYISLGCGVLFVFELIRYLKAADSVLPEKAVYAEYINPAIPKVCDPVIVNEHGADDSEIIENNTDVTENINEKNVEENK